MVAPIRNKEMTIRTEFKPNEGAELTISLPSRAELSDEGPIRSKHLDSVIVMIGNEEMPIRAECEPIGVVELAVSCSV